VLNDGAARQPLVYVGAKKADGLIRKLARSYERTPSPKAINGGLGEADNGRKLCPPDNALLRSHDDSS
jgi:hypothetical protein